MSQNSSNSPIVIVALIGLIGTLGGGLFNNWDKIFPKQLPVEPSTKVTTSPTISVYPIEKFSQLRRFLGKPDWRRADEETAKVLVESETINPEDLDKISCQALKDVDKVWAENSGGKFGLSSQLKKWEESNGDGALFSVSVGWQKSSGSTITYDEMLKSFSLSSSKAGQLPRRYLWKFNKQEQFQEFFDKFRSCRS